jgi:hypothetical protein
VQFLFYDCSMVVFVILYCTIEKVRKYGLDKKLQKNLKFLGSNPVGKLGRFDCLLVFFLIFFLYKT